MRKNHHENQAYELKPYKGHNTFIDGHCLDMIRRDRPHVKQIKTIGWREQGTLHVDENQNTEPDRIKPQGFYDRHINRHGHKQECKVVHKSSEDENGQLHEYDDAEAACRKISEHGVNNFGSSKRVVHVGKDCDAHDDPADHAQKPKCGAKGFIKSFPGDFSFQYCDKESGDGPDSRRLRGGGNAPVNPPPAQ